MSVDKEALWETLDRVIAADVEGKWDQTTWVCGTTGCFCGHRALLDGAEIVGVNCVRLPGGVWLDLDSEDDAHSWSLWGRDRFGLTYQQAEGLFHADNTLEDLKDIVDRICSEPT
jgi:hypothetical protein